MIIRVQQEPNHTRRATKLQPQLRTTTWRRYCDTLDLLTCPIRQGRSADPFLLANGFFEMSHARRAEQQPRQQRPDQIPNFGFYVCNISRITLHRIVKEICSIITLSMPLQTSFNWEKIFSLIFGFSISQLIIRLSLNFNFS